MPYGEDGAGDGRHGERRECRGGKACRKSRILHADFDGEGLRLGRRKFQQLAEAKTAAVAEQVMENHHGEHDSSRGENLYGIVRDDCGHNHRNRNYGNERQNLHGAGSPFAKKFVDDEPEGNRHDDNLHNGKEHRHHIYVHGGTQEQIRNCRRQHGSEQRIHARHAHGKRHIAFRKISDDVA